MDRRRARDDCSGSPADVSRSCAPAPSLTKLAALQVED
jgi:hypothetical protein